MATQNSLLIDRKRSSPDITTTDFDSVQICSWPRFLLIKGTNDERPLNKLSPFAVNKAIVAVLGSDPFNIKKLRNGSILVEVDKETQSKKLLKTTKLNLTMGTAIPIDVSPHYSLNTKKRVIRCPDIKDCTNDEILEGLKAEGVIKLDRILIFRDRQRKPTGTSPMQSLYVEANEPSLYLRFDKLCVQYALKFKSNPDNPAYDVVFNTQYYDLYDKKPSAIRSSGHHVGEYLSVVCPQLDLIQTVSLPDDPPWTIQKPHIDLFLTHKEKHLGDDCMFQSLFGELRSYYSDHRAIYTDGSKAENRVAAAATSNNLSAQAGLPGNASIFTAELQALKMAFNIVKNCDWDRFIIFTDSLSSLQALDSNYCYHPFIQDILKLFNDCFLANKKVVLAWVPNPVGIKGNETADELAKQALNFNVLDLKVPYTDLKVNVNSVFKQKWQAQWNACPDNKLFQINPTVGDFYVWTGLSCREEIVITRARIGHTYFTHSYLLKGEDMPWRIPCHCPDTVKHILLDCIDLRDTRIKYYRDINMMEKLFNENVYNVINYLKECGLFKKF